MISKTGTSYLIRFFLVSSFLELVLFLSSIPQISAQCLRIRDARRNNALTFTPKKNFKCLANNQSPATSFTLTFEDSVSNVHIDWGPFDSLYVARRRSVTYTYQDTGTFEYVITQQNCPTPIKGYFVNNYNRTCPDFFWNFPTPDSTKCLPHTIDILNASPKQNGFTEWIINWGDQKRDTADYPNLSKVFSHTYKAGSKLCNVLITVTYRNSCGTAPCSQAISVVKGPYKFAERDSAIVTPAAAVMCTPTSITLKDDSKLNCLDTANRQVNWSSFEGFSNPLPNPGNDIWRPRGPAKNRSIIIPESYFNNVPADSLYKVRYRIRNRCGLDTADVIIRRIAPNEPKFRVITQDGCIGSVIRFENQTFVRYGTMRYIWEFGDGTIDSTFTGEATHIYQNFGSYPVKLTARTVGFGGKFCSLTYTDTVRVRPSVLPGISSTAISGCDSLFVTLKNTSRFTNNVRWRGWEFFGGSAGPPVTQPITGDTNYFPGPSSSNPAEVEVAGINPLDSSAFIRFKKYGLYQVKLRAITSGCDVNTGNVDISVRPSPKLRYRLSSTNLCQNETFFLYDSSRVMETDPRGLPPDFNTISWTIRLGNDTTISSSSPVTGSFDSRRAIPLKFKSAGTFRVKITVSAGGNCAVSDSIEVTVKPSATPRFSLLRNACASDSVIVINQTVENASKYIYRIYKGNGLLIGQQLQEFVRDDKGNQLLVLPYVPPGDSTYYFLTLTTVMYTAGDSCVNTSNPVVIKVGPTPVPGINLSPLDGCTPLNNVVIRNASINLPLDGLAEFNWSLGSLGTFTGNAPPPLTFTNDGILNKRDTIRLCIRTGNNCTYCRETFVLTYPAPKGTINLPDSICSGETVNLSATTVGAITFNWEFTDYDGSSSAQPSLSKVFNNATRTPRFYTIRLVLRSAADCPTVLERVLKVNPNPEFGFESLTSQETNCGFLKAKFYYLSDTNVASYKWKFGSGDSLITTNRDTIFRTFGNETTSQIQLPVTLTATSDRGCKTTKTDFLPVNPLVKARFKMSADSGCTPMRIVLTDSSTQASNVRRWLVDGVGLPDQASVLNYVLQNPILRDSTFTIQLAVRNDVGVNCKDTATRKVKVFSRPRSNDLIASPAEGCSPLTVKFTGNAENAVLFNWLFDDGSSILIDSQSTSHTFNNLNQIANQVFNVARISRSVKGCTDTTIRPVVVKPRTQAIIASNTFDPASCSPLAVQFTAANSINFTTVEWNFGDNTPSSSSLSPSHVFNNQSDTVQKYRVRLIAVKNQTNSCPDTSYAEITVNPAPSAGFSMSKSFGCGPFSDTLRDLSNGGTTSFWTFQSGDLSTSLFPDATGMADTVLGNSNFNTKTVKVIQTVLTAQGCKDTSSQSILIYPDVSADFNLPDTVCSGTVVVFQNVSQNPPGAYTWNFGDGLSSSAYNPPGKTYSNLSLQDSTYQVGLSFTSNIGNCAITLVKPITINPEPVSSFSISRASGCGPFLDTLQDLSTGAQVSYWTLQSGDVTSTLFPDASGMADTLLSNTNFIQKSIRVIQTVITSNGCRDTSAQSILIYPNLTADFSFVDTACSGNTIQFQNTSQNFQGTYAWDLGDGQISSLINPAPRKYFNFSDSDTTYNISLTSISPVGNCTRTVTKPLKVYATPRADFVFLSDSTIQLPVNTVTIGNRTPFLNSWKYQWDFDDGSGIRKDSSASFTYTFQIGDEYFEDTIFKVTLKAISPKGCQSIDVGYMSILPGIPVANFDVTPRTICAGDKVLFTNLSSFAYRSLWSFWDEETPLQKDSIKGGNPQVSFASPGRKTIKLKVSAGGRADSLVRSGYVDVYPNPSGYFKVYPPTQRVVATEDEATFSDMRRCEDAAGCTFRWDFGDGTGDTTFNNEPVKHIYQQEGTYIIQLIVTNSLGCTNGIYRDSIVVVPARDLAVPNAFIPLNVPGGCQIDNFKRLPPCIFYPLASGMTAIRMQIFNRWGQQIFESRELGEGWDGFFNRQPVPSGTYIYKIYAEFVNGNSDIITGDVTVIR